MTRHKRRWGCFEVLAETPDHKVKRLTLNAGAGISLQTHTKRAEQWTLVSGSALVRLGENIMTMKDAGQSVSIPAGRLHQLTNLGMQKLVIIEVQTGTYFGEDDIERFDDPEQWRTQRHKEVNSSWAA